MILANQPLSTDASSGAYQEPRWFQVSSPFKYDFDQPEYLMLDQRYFAFGEYFLVLENCPTIALSRRTRELEVQGWSIRLPFERRGDVDREIIRRFLLLHGKAERGQLANRETADWENILRQVDYQKFCADHAPSLYVEGKLLARNREKFEIEWNDETKESVDRSIGLALDILNPDEHFKAFARFGTGNKLSSITDVVPVPAPEASDTEAIWQSWQTSRSK
jgi:hypothetical protein